MNANSTPGIPAGKRAMLPAIATWFFRLLRRYWLTEAALLLVVIIGLYAGWSTARQWSDTFFFAAFAQMIVAFISMQGSFQETRDSSTVRYVSGGNINETYKQLIADTYRKESFGFRAFIGGLLTLLIAFLIVKL